MPVSLVLHEAATTAAEAGGQTTSAAAATTAAAIARTAATAAAATAQSNGSHAFVTTTRGYLAESATRENIEVKGAAATSGDQTGAHPPGTGPG